ncbi:DUF2158 domain-containing protein [Chryseobacterium sp. WX]|uniref:DUF2158 domain-containing protein n=1 Tax=Chryseobacterium sp. WX TaxID=3031803 RepID=UPI0024099046|nr:DUF2158 domain-containing protein [Chryseobacterium sp. WX]WFB68213.1 DUF2158 domain-containing protein [Chryseobacterium sp. WX]
MIKEGILVKLKSGGPTMTVKFESELAEGLWVCNWFAGDQLNEATFSEDQLDPL